MPSSERINLLIAEYIERQERGEAVDQRAFLASHPDEAAALESFFSTLGLIQPEAGKSPPGHPVPPAADTDSALPDVTAAWRPSSDSATPAPPPWMRSHMARQGPRRVDADTRPSAGEREGPLDVPASARPAGRRVARYELQTKLGAGAFGEVYLARDVQLGRDVALKLPRPGILDDPELRHRFLQEARAAACLQHPHIVALFDAGVDAGQHYIASAFIEGKTLAEKIRGKTIDFRHAARVVRKLAEALDYAHAQGVIHRDVKPQNVMVDKKGDPYLMDFGLARLEQASARLTQDGMLIGTPIYMSPEQASGVTERLSPASDQYSLGVVLYEMLAGRVPFTGKAQVVLLQVLREPIPPPTTYRPEIPLDLETICLKALAKDPAQRYSTCADFAADLECWQKGESISARPATPLERFGRWCRREPLLAGLISTAIVLLLAIATISSIAWVRVNNLATALENSGRVKDDLVAKLGRSIRDRDEIAARELAEREKSAPRLVDVVLGASAEFLPDGIELLRPLGAPAIAVLKDRFQSTKTPATQRLHAAIALAALGEVDTDFLVASIPNAPDDECRNIVQALGRSRSRTVWMRKQNWTSKIASRDIDTRIRAAIVSLYLDEPQPALDLCADADPALRHLFIEAFADWNAGLLDLTLNPTDPMSAPLNTALCLAIGRIDPTTLGGFDDRAGRRILLECYQKFPDTATHSAADWALRQWNVVPPELPEEFDKPAAGRAWYVNPVGLAMLKLPPGEFETPPAKPGDRPIESKIPDGLFLSDREISVAHFRTFFDDPDTPDSDKPDSWTGPDVAASPTSAHPVQRVSWHDAVLFCNWLSRQEGRTPCYERTGKTESIVVGGMAREFDVWGYVSDADGYRLPAEVEWEYACRTISQTSFCCGEDEDVLREYAAFAADSTSPCAIHLPNRWGYFDMHGNVAEWCSTTRDGAGIASATRGGHWDARPADLSSSAHELRPRPHRDRLTGFRVARRDTRPAEIAAITPPAVAPPAAAPPAAQPPLKVLTGPLVLELVRIPAGTYWRGSAAGTKYANPDESPRHEVRISRDFDLGKYEVTQKQWKDVMGTEPWKGHPDVKAGDDYPATYVGWSDAVDFCKLLSTTNGRTFRLPTEAEWEYAARGGTSTRFSFGDASTKLELYGWNGTRCAQPVGRKRPNPWGLFDMHGNVAEFCEDGYSALEYSHYAGNVALDPAGAPADVRVIRGGAWFGESLDCRSAARAAQAAAIRSGAIGFRVAALVDDAKAPPSVVAPETKGSFEFTDSLDMSFVHVPAGEYRRGSPASDADAGENEKPAHLVRITEAFLIGQHEVTQRAWKKVVGSEPWKTVPPPATQNAPQATTIPIYIGSTQINPSGSQSPHPMTPVGDDFPAVGMSWREAESFCSSLSTMAGRTFRLPTEAQWEYACRGGATSRYSFGSDMARLSRYGWFRSNSQAANGRFSLSMVGQKDPNPYGLYDMHGNAEEWCRDGFDANGYRNFAGSIAEDPYLHPWIAAGQELPTRVCRGGSFILPADHCRSASRHDAITGSPYIGFRVVTTP